MSIPIVKAFLTQNRSPVENCREICVWGKRGRNVKFCLRHPQKVHPCAKRRHLTYWT